MQANNKPILVVVLGHTAGGKTAFAAQLAHLAGGEIISADSRQVYRGMDIGTGKDYSDYIVNGHEIKVHLLDIVDPGYEYSVFEFQNDFKKAYALIRERNRVPFLCGGTGLYLQSVLKGYDMLKVPKNVSLREKLVKQTDEELIQVLSSYRSLHNTTDIYNRERLLRAIEIEDFKRKPEAETEGFPDFSSLVIGIRYERDERRNRITKRLIQRLESGMIEEAEGLIRSGITPVQLEFYGLEYKYLAWYITGRINYQEMFDGLNTAIHQFSKRQMTWFRKMEREGIKIHWIEGEIGLEEKVSIGMSFLGL